MKHFYQNKTTILQAFNINSSVIVFAYLTRAPYYLSKVHETSNDIIIFSLTERP